MQVFKKKERKSHLLAQLLLCHVFGKTCVSVALVWSRFCLADTKSARYPPSEDVLPGPAQIKSPVWARTCMQLFLRSQ